MALLTRLDLDEAKRLGRLHGLELESVEALELGSVNSNFRATTSDGRVLFLRIYEEQAAEGALSELALLDALSRTGVPVPVAIRPRGAAPASSSGKPFAVFPWISGQSLCLSRVEREHCRQVGNALALVHEASSSVTRLGPGRFGPADMIARLDSVSAGVGRPELTSDVARIKTKLEHYRALRSGDLPSGIVHGDLFRDNVLWVSSGDGANAAPVLASLLDFESAFHGPFVYDLCVTIAAWCYRERFEPELVRALAAGYCERRPLSATERHALPVEAALGCLRFATTRITDFSLRAPPGVAPARDYRRFLARLEAVEAGELERLIDSV